MLVYGVMAVWHLVGPAWRALPFLGKTALAVAIVAALWFGPGMRRSSQSSPEGEGALNREEWERIVAILIMGFFVVFFWMGFEQAGGTMNLFADKQTDRHLGSWEIPASYFQAINPLGIVLMGPLIAAMWTRIDKSRFALPTPAKLAIGMIILGLGFIVLAIGQKRADLVGMVGPWWLFWVYVLHTLGELCLSPVGLSMVSKLAPLRVASLMMGIWYLANAAANYLAGTLEGLLAGSSVPIYWFLVGSSIGAGVVLLAITPLLKKLMHGKA